MTTTPPSNEWIHPAAADQRVEREALLVHVVIGALALGIAWARDRDASGRPARVYDALEAVRAQWNELQKDRLLARLAFFGDPEGAPGEVVVWGLYGRGTEQEWIAGPAGSSRVHALAWQVNAALREVGYPFAVDVGVAPVQEADAAGGDYAFLGVDGRRRPVQAPAFRG